MSFQPANHKRKTAQNDINNNGNSKAKMWARLKAMDSTPKMASNFIIPIYLNDEGKKIAFGHIKWIFIVCKLCASFITSIQARSPRNGYGFENGPNIKNC